MQFIVGAYVSAPPEGTEAYLRHVCALPNVAGLEVQYADGSDELAAFAGRYPDTDVVLTTVVSTITHNRANPEFGLASESATGRAEAVALGHRVNAAVRAINEQAGRAAVRAVELHSAPRGHGQPAALAASLAELAHLDWQGALVTVEHCDSAGAGPVMQKGYLRLDDELSVLAGMDDRFAITINWGRSAIDGRSGATALEHIRRSVDAGRLGGLMFSGVSAEAGPYGEAWTDAHPPPAGDDARFAGLLTEPASLLTPSAIADALHAAGGQPQFTGLKIAAPPSARTPPARLAYVRDALHIMSTIADDCADA